jgi:predicted outer membrane repeat protein
MLATANLGIAGLLLSWGAVPAQAQATVRAGCGTADLVAAVSSASEGETLSLAAGCTYVLTAGLPLISVDLTIDGNGATLERSTAAGTPPFAILATSGTDTVDDLNFTNGDGAIVGGGGELTVQGGTFLDNSDSAIFYRGFGSGPDVTGATFTGNTGTAGGAIYDYGNAGGGPVVTDSTFTGNTATSGGGAIDDFSAVGGTDVTGSTFTGNSAPFAGAIAGEFGDYSGDTIDDNSASDAAGISDVYLTVTGSDIYDNHATGYGGGLSLGYPALDYTTGTVTDTDIHGNTAQVGAGIYANEITLSLKGDTISGNTASSDGGGLYVQAAEDLLFPSSVTVTGGTFSGNSAAGQGGGIYNEGIVSLAGGQVTGNSAGTGGGGIYDGSAQYATGTGGTGLPATTLTSTPVTGNTPDNCEPAGTITGCTNTTAPAGPITSGYHASACVDDSGGSAANDTPVVLDPCDGSAQQQWSVEPDGSIRTNGKCLDIYRDEKTNDAPVELYDCTGGANQVWQQHGATLVNPVSGKCLDDPRYNTAPGTQLDIYTCTGGANQNWTIP